MRSTLLLTAVLLRVCAPELAPAALAAHHGGTVVAADDRAVEVSVTGDVVEAWVVDADGVPIEASVDPITVTVQLETGPAPVTVVWDPDTRSYKGTAPAVIVPGPVEVAVVVAGEPRVGHVDTIIVVPAAPSTVVVGGAPPPAVVTTRDRPRVTVVAPEPHVVVTAPPPPTVVVAPPSPPTVVVRPPSPPGIVVVPPSPPGVVIVPPSPGVHVHVEEDHDHHHDEHHDHGRHIGGGHGGGRGHH